MAKFQTSARSVDMLGRQQIAGIPTAISEIFKNAYDAYAEHVRGDYFPDASTLMIRDDGIGMSLPDFENRWLTIGTDSKAANSRQPLPLAPAGAPIRKQMGEKGIGRLAIASTGPQLLLVTRARSAVSGAQQLVVALLQWSMFEVPGLVLDEVQIPVRSVGALDDVSPELLGDMVDELETSLTLLEQRLTASDLARVRTELQVMRFDPRPFLTINGPRLDRQSGTAFIVRPVSKDVDAALQQTDLKPENFSVSNFQRFLLGFTDEMVNPGSGPKFDTEFFQHEGASVDDLLDPSTYFWESSDFKTTDHTIEGSFDEFGTFSGAVSIYGREPVEYVEPWTSAAGRRIACGGFDLKFGYVQGQASESRLDQDDWVLMTKRLERIGGLYVYRDGIRVLPYGNSDNDYLEIEKRRSLNAGTYYFSYRRMFGAVSLDSELNKALQEKAGREGFRDNQAYRDFSGVLKDFLIQLAATFFSTDREESEEWRAERKRLGDRANARSARERREKAARDKFSREVDRRLSYLEDGAFTTVIKSALDGLRIATTSRGPVTLAELEAAERTAIASLQSVEATISLSRPAEMALTNDQERNWRSLGRLVDSASDQLHAAFDTIDELVRTAPRAEGAASPPRSDELNRNRLRADAASIERDLLEDAAEVEQRISKLRDSLVLQARSHLSEYSVEVNEMLSTEKITAGKELELSSEIRSTGRAHSDALNDLLRHVELLANGDSEDIERKALREQLLDLQGQIDSNLELLQLGQAVQIVSHEFEASILAVRAGLKTLSPWGKSTPRLEPVVQDLRASFAHLDAYLRLFTPLQRRLYREEVMISGQQIADFVQGVFVERLRRHNVELNTTERFRSWRFKGYPSTFYPVFINLVDNAIHWTASEKAGRPAVTLDADDEALYVRDNGPGVRARDAELIFLRGFSRRRSGRGLGLSLAKELLDRDNWTLSLESNQSGASFRLSPDALGDAE